MMTMKRRAFLILALVGSWLRAQPAQAQSSGISITDIDIVPDPSGCGHAEVRCRVDGRPLSFSITRPMLTRSISSLEDAEAAVLARIRSHIAESGLTTPTAIRSDLQTRSFKI